MSNLLVIGDLQGCLQSLHQLLERAPPHDRLLFVGDLVNRGPQSLEVLRFVRALGERAVVLLGNHDLHLLAAAAGVRAPHAGDTLDAILAAPDRAALIDWVRCRPLAHVEAGALFVHAGVPPQWSIDQTLALAAEVQQRLGGPDYAGFLAHMYGNQPARWNDALAGDDRLRCIVNGLTRMRLVTPDGSMDFATKESVTVAPPGLLAWFDHPERASQPSRGGLPVVFGHWSARGLMLRDDAIGLDTGCVWGGALTALSWPSRAIHQVRCPPYRQPGP